MLPSPPKEGDGDGENDKGRGGGERGRFIVLIQKKVVKLGNLGRTTGWIHSTVLVKSGRVHNLTKGLGSHYCTHKGEGGKGGRRREGESNSRGG